jgi:oligopeptide/dipeptide ABC transporter ATP-binding protein
MSPPLLEVRGLCKTFRAAAVWKAAPPVRAVDGVDLDIGRGEIVGVVGESGSGKTTLGRTVLRLVEPTSGSVRFDGIDVLALRPRDLRRLRRRMQIVFQDPGAALNPRMKVRTLVGEPLVVHGLVAGRQAVAARVAALLEEVGLDPGTADRYPGELSGGQKQRVGIARAIGLRPDLVVCDEPIAALDPSIQAQIINLLADLQRRLGMAYLFIAHDLTVVGHLCDRIAVMYLGRIVEELPGGTAGETRPLHPYTRALYDAEPPPDPERARGVRRGLPGELPSPLEIPAGCRFHPRCRFAEARCRTEDPALRDMPGRRRVACHLAEDIADRTEDAALAPAGRTGPTA